MKLQQLRCPKLSQIRDYLLKQPAGNAVIAAFVCGVVTHLYGLVNTIHNYDDITQLPSGYGTGVTSGRWFLSLIGDFFGSLGGNWNLPVINGLLFLALLALSAGFLVHTLHIEKKASAILVGMLFVVFPSAASTMIFRYTAVYYGLAILLSVLAVWILEKRSAFLPLSALCMACSLGIYQAYMPITISLFVLLLLRQTLLGQRSLWELIRRGLFYCSALILGLLLYYVFLRLSLALSHSTLNNYQGIQDMGNLSFSELPALIRRAVGSVLRIPVKDYCGINTLGILKGIYLLLGILSLCAISHALIFRVRKWSMAFLTAVLCFAFVLAVNFIVIMCPKAGIYTLMVYSFVLLSCAPLMIIECLPSANRTQLRLRSILSRGCSWLLAVLICTYIYTTNANYSVIYFANRQTENYITSLVTQVRMSEGFDPEQRWAFIGTLSDPLLQSKWNAVSRFGGFSSSLDLLRGYSWPHWITHYIGYTVPMASAEEIQELASSESVLSMPCWPKDGSIQIIEDTIVIKFSQPE